MVSLIFNCSLLCAQSHGLSSETPWESAEWSAALRYRPTLLGGIESEVLSPSFFLTTLGASNPKDEWIASLLLFEQALDQLDKQAVQPHKALQPLCLHPDRYLIIARFLGEEDHLDQLFSKHCRDYVTWSTLASQGLAWTHAGPIFTRPESSLGHSSLWVKSQSGLTYALSFGAHLEEPFDRLWALLGIATGDWSIQPYHTFERIYREIEGRDLTRLNLLNIPKGGGSSTAKRFLGLHLMSLRGSDLRYSFIGNNCATQSARLLDVAATLAGENHTYPRSERWGLAPLEAIESVQSFMDQPHRLPSLIEEVSIRSERLSSAEQTALSTLSQEIDDFILGKIDVPRSRTKADTDQVWYLALLIHDINYAHLLLTPPKTTQGHKARIWKARQNLLIGLGKTTEHADFSGSITHPLPTFTPQLTAADRVRIQVNYPFTPTDWSHLAPHLYWKINLWSNMLSDPQIPAEQRLFLMGPSLWGKGLQFPQGGHLISLWSLGVLNEAISRWSWQFTGGAGAHELDEPFDWFWLKGQWGAAIKNHVLKLKLWLHAGARTGMTQTQKGMISPYLSLGGRGNLNSYFGWFLFAQAGLNSKPISYSWLHPEPLSLHLNSRLALGSLARLVFEIRSYPFHPSDRFQAWIGLEL